MTLERVRPTVLRATFRAHEFAALIAAVRYAADLAPADMPAGSVSCASCSATMTSRYASWHKTLIPAPGEDDPGPPAG